MLLSAASSLVHQAAEFVHSWHFNLLHICRGALMIPSSAPTSKVFKSVLGRDGDNHFLHGSGDILGKLVNDDGPVTEADMDRARRRLHCVSILAGLLLAQVPKGQALHPGLVAIRRAVSSTEWDANIAPRVAFVQHLSSSLPFVRIDDPAQPMCFLLTEILVEVLGIGDSFLASSDMLISEEGRDMKLQAVHSALHHIFIRDHIMPAVWTALATTTALDWELHAPGTLRYLQYFFPREGPEATHPDMNPALGRRHGPVVFPCVCKHEAACIVALHAQLWREDKTCIVLQALKNFVDTCNSARVAGDTVVYIPVNMASDTEMGRATMKVWIKQLAAGASKWNPTFVNRLCLLARMIWNLVPTAPMATVATDILGATCGMAAVGPICAASALASFLNDNADKNLSTTAVIQDCVCKGLPLPPTTELVTPVDPLYGEVEALRTVLAV